MSKSNQNQPPKTNTPTQISEGSVKRGGVAPKPTAPRPTIKPISQKGGAK